MKKLYRLGIVDSSNCAFCHDEGESIRHSLFFCTKSGELWKHVLSWLRDKNIYVGTLNKTDLIFGNLMLTDQDFILINHILFLDKYYIFLGSACRMKRLPCCRGFIARAGCIFKLSPTSLGKETSYFPL